MTTEQELTKDEVIEALKEVYDPEIPVNIVDLGLVYDIEVSDGEVAIEMTLTAQGCGMGRTSPSRQSGLSRRLRG